MSKWQMRGHFRYLRFKTFPMTLKTPQCKVFWALLSSSKHSGVPEDSKSSLFFQVLGFTPHLAKVGLRQQDMRNIAKKLTKKTYKKHDNDAKSVHMWARKNPNILFYYQEIGFEVGGDLSRNNLLLTIQIPW